MAKRTVNVDYNCMTKKRVYAAFNYADQVDARNITP